MKTKRFLSVLIAVLMLVSCFAISASADVVVDTTQEGSITINLYGSDNIESAKDATNSTTFSNTAVDKGAAGQTVDGTKYTALNGSTFKITLVKDVNGNDVADGAPQTKSTENGKVEFTNLTLGQYKVENTAIASNQGGKVADFYVDVPMTVYGGDDLNYNVNVYPKVPTTENPRIAKSVKGSDDREYGTKASINRIGGEYANWKIDVNVPANIANYKKFVVTDVINTENLELIGTVSKDNVSVSGVETLTDDFESSFTIAYAKDTITLTVTDFTKFAAVAQGKTLTIKFDTNIKDAGVAKKIPNDVELTYVNAANANNDVITGIENVPGYDPENPTTVPDGYTSDPDDPNKFYKEDEIDNNGGDPDDDPTTTGDGDKNGPDPYIFTGLIKLEKYFDTTKAAKDEVTFELYEKGSSTVIATGLSQADGTVSFVGLDNPLDDTKTYVIRETKVKKGYELLGFEFEVEINEDNLKGNLTTTTLSAVTQNNETKVIKVVNPASPKLPLTGGMGVGMFAVIGLALAAIGGVALRKTRKAEDC